MMRYMTKRAIFNKGMLFAVGVPILMFYQELFFGWGHFFDTIKTSGVYENGLTIMGDVFALSIYIVFAGMFPGIPYGFSLLEERNSSYLKFILQRMSAKRYICRKIVTVGISGAVSTLIPYLALALPVWLVTAHSDVPPYENLTFALRWQLVAANSGEWAVYLLKGLLMVLFGILWAEVTLFLSLFVKNKYIAFVLPYILYELVWILFPVNNLNPVALIRSDASVDGLPLGWSFAEFILLIVLVFFGIYFVFRRQSGNDKF